MVVPRRYIVLESSARGRLIDRDEPFVLVGIVDVVGSQASQSPGDELNIECRHAIHDSWELPSVISAILRSIRTGLIIHGMLEHPGQSVYWVCIT